PPQRVAGASVSTSAASPCRFASRRLVDLRSARRRSRLLNPPKRTTGSACQICVMLKIREMRGSSMIVAGCALLVPAANAQILHDVLKVKPRPNVILSERDTAFNPAVDGFKFV